jgi:SGT1 protein
MEDPKDGLKWFGEGFDGFPKRFPEDCVDYSLFVVDSALNPREHLNQLEVVRKEALKITKQLLKDYIWQKDEFNLELEVQGEAGTCLFSNHM